MGLRMESGSRRSQVSEYSAVIVPRWGPGSPFKGHLCTKSNAFCIDSSQNLTSQYLIRDHMVCHYNKMLSAKAAVDCSMPKSRLCSIKFADQQRREKLKKKIAKREAKMNVRESGCRACSRGCRRLLPSSCRKSSLEMEDTLCPCAGQAQCLSRAPCPYAEHGLVCSSPAKCAPKCSRIIFRASCSPSCVRMSRLPSKRCALSCSHVPDSFLHIGCPQRHQGNHLKTNSGDLLERHSECFTKCRKPFTPRTLKSDAKSFLSEYRYYTPARRKKCHRRRHAEAQTQTDTMSFPSADKVHVRKVVGAQKVVTSKAEDKSNILDEPERGADGCPCSILRETSGCPKKCSSRRTVDADEEELLYLTFIEDVTNEILRLGLFSNRVLDQLFECCIEENKNRLDEGKMRQMLDELKSDLGCSQDSETELSREGQEALDSLEELEFTSKGHRLRRATESEELLETIDLSLEEPNRCESLLCSERSRETQSREDFSEIMDAGTESDFCGGEFEEHPCTSSRCEAAFNVIACDSDLEVNKELDELEENFAEALHISHSYS